MNQPIYSPDQDLILRLKTDIHDLRYEKDKRRAILSVGFLLIGITTFILTTLLVIAATTRKFASLEPEVGSLSGTASVVNDGTASGNKSVLFSQPVTSPTTPMEQIMADAPYWGTGLWWPDAGVNFTTTYNTHVQRVGLGKTPDMLRTFGTSNDGKWTWSTLQGGASGTSSPTITGHDGGNWHSFKSDLAGAATGKYNANWTASIKTIPVNGRLKIITLHHEPENDLPSTNYDAWVLDWTRAQIEVGKAVKAANHPEVLFAPVFMGSWYIDGVAANHPSSLNRWIQLWESNGLLDDLQQVWDMIGWDPYHEGSTKTPPQLAAPRNTAGYWFDKTLAWTKTNFPGKKYGIGETGFTQRGTTAADRLAWLRSVESWANTNKDILVAICYYDASIEELWYLSLGTTEKVDATYQSSVAEFWGSHYR